MSKVPKQRDVRKQELIEVAFKHFFEKGYEKTSVRDIIKEVGGEVGMFYHYFKSKDEIFELAVEYCISEEFLAFSKVSRDESLSFKQSLEKLITLQFKTINKYNDEWSGKIHWSMASAIHKKTLDRLIPYIENLIKEALINKEIQIMNPNIGLHEITLFLVYGVSGVLHEKSLKELPPNELDEKQEEIRNLINLIFIYNNI